MTNYESTLHTLLVTNGGHALLEAVVYMAHCYWERAGCEEDFCWQGGDPGQGVLIFGSTNRVTWRVESGFRIDRGCCTRRFLEANEGEPR
jgi:hypothetical protein